MGECDTCKRKRKQKILVWNVTYFDKNNIIFVKKNVTKNDKNKPTDLTSHILCDILYVRNHTFQIYVSTFFL